MESKPVTEAAVPKTMQELADDVRVVQEAVANLAKVMNEYFGQQTAGLGQMFAYEANRRLEEVSHRIHDVFSLKAQRSQENIDRMVGDALKKASQTGSPVVSVDGTPRQVITPETP